MSPCYPDYQYWLVLIKYVCLSMKHTSISLPDRLDYPPVFDWVCVSRFQLFVLSICEFCSPVSLSLFTMAFPFSIYLWRHVLVPSYFTLYVVFCAML